jgi:hypothetical protein
MAKVVLTWLEPAEARALTATFARVKRWDRVDCKLQQRRVVLRQYNYTSRAACVLLQLASDMSHCPSKVNKAQKHCCGQLKVSNQQTEYYE